MTKVEKRGWDFREADKGSQIPQWERGIWEKTWRKISKPCRPLREWPSEPLFLPEVSNKSPGVGVC